MGVTLHDMRTHVQTLAEETGARVVTPVPLLNSRVDWTVWGVKLSLPEVASSISYAVALHEIGHVKTFSYYGEWLMAFQQERPSLRHHYLELLDREVKAWTWAREHALVWTPHMQAAHGYGMKTHVRATCIAFVRGWI